MDESRLPWLSQSGALHILFRRASQCFPRMEYDIRFTRMMIMLSNGVHCVGGCRAAPVDPDDGAVTNSATIVPGYRGASGNCLERWCFLASHDDLLMFDESVPVKRFGLVGDPVIRVLELEGWKMSRHFMPFASLDAARRGTLISLTRE